jgi:HPt (histidine-containing phosphotransfer) domain-containing protein
MDQIDVAAILKQTNHNWRLIHQLCKLFQEYSAPYMEQIERAIEEGRSADIYYYAHKAKAGFGYLGFGEIVEALERIETCPEHALFPRAKAEYSRLRRRMPEAHRQVSQLQNEAERHLR